MNDKKLSDLTTEELKLAMQKKKSKSILNAVLIGFFVGIAFYSIVKNSLGWVTLIPLFLAYK
jgi:hypothetical protein